MLERLTVNEKANHEQRHKAALCIVHVVPPSDPLVRLGAQLVFLAGRVSWRDQRLAKMIDEILHNGSRFGNDQRFSAIRTLNTDNGRLSKRVDFLQFGGGQKVRPPFVDFDIVVYLEFFQ
jgi:hypothetical protein